MGLGRHVVAASAALALCSLSLRAEADSARAWAVARDQLPASTTKIVGADLTAITKSSLFTQFMPLALAQADVKHAFDLVKSACKIDPLTAIHGVVVAAGEDRGSGAIFLSLGVDQAKLVKCLEDVARASGEKGKFAVKKTGAITELSMGSDTLYASWFGSDVIAVAFKAQEKGALEKWINGKGALDKGALGRLVASTNTRAAVWGATLGTKDLDPGMKAGRGSLTMAGGNLAIDVRATYNDAKLASAAAAKANADLAKAVAGGNVPDAMKSVAKQTTIKADGADLVLKASVAESAVLPLIRQMMTGGGF